MGCKDTARKWYGEILDINLEMNFDGKVIPQLETHINTLSVS